MAATAILLGIDCRRSAGGHEPPATGDGRFQTLHAPKGYTAIVDYAHTPRRTCQCARHHPRLVRDGKGRIICVCGCGGDRDATKRPIMAHEAARRSDRTILTSDNPRTEDPEKILLDMEARPDDDLTARPSRLPTVVKPYAWHASSHSPATWCWWPARGTSHIRR